LVTVACVFLFHGERQDWWQTLGLVGSSAAVALVVAG
jgi:drug/metabolite transporter (DMT)-like permease